MKPTSTTIIFFGTEDFSLTALQGLVEAGFSVGAVVTKPDSRKGRGNKLSSPAVKTYAESHAIPVLQPQSLKEIEADLKAFDHPIGVLVSYGKLIPQRIIDIFSPGIINLHPSLLPHYRGPSPIESAILHGDTETGVTIMNLTAGMDAGPLYIQTMVPLTGTETKPELYQRLADIGTRLLISTLPSIISGELLPQPQDEANATYCSLLDKKEAWPNFQLLTAQEAEQRVRAFLGYPSTKTTILGHPVTITKAAVTTSVTTALDIPCREGVLHIAELIAPSGRAMSGDDFLRGYSA